MTLIIGASEPERPRGLPEAEVDLPPPSTAPAAHAVVTEAQLAAWLEHDSLVVRQYAVEQILHRKDAALSAHLTSRVNDVPGVAVEAIRGLEAMKVAEAVEPMLEAFAEARGEVLAALASAIGTLAPDRLVEAVRSRGRMDDEGFAGVASAVAILGNEDAVAFLDRALNRAGVVSVERRGSLYSSALLSGEPRLVQRALGQAIGESEREDPPAGSSYPARAAVAGLAGGPPDLGRKDAAEELWDVTTRTLREEADAALDEQTQAQLTQALADRRLDRILEVLRPFTTLEPWDPPESESDADDLGTMPRRRQGLLEGLIAQRAALARLDASAGAVFAAMAARAVAVVAFGHRSEAEAPALRAMAKVLDGVSPETLAEGSEAGLTQTLSELSERAMRPALVALAKERVGRAATLRRLARACFGAGHGEALIHAASESSDSRVHMAVARAAVQMPEAAEAAALAILSQSPLEEGPARFALVVAEQVRSERLALVLGRRFYSLRELDRTLLAQALLRCGDPRTVPLLESRSFADEPEEAAWVVLALAHGESREGKLAEAARRVEADFDEHEPEHGREPEHGGEPAPKLRVPLRCTSCGETLGYAFEHAYVDVEAKAAHGDPAFVGEVRCKACGAETLEPTDETGHILSMHMMQFLEEMRAGQVSQRPLVTPAQTELAGRKVGMARAVRELTESIQSSPDAIRPRLHRARLCLLLKRGSVDSDLEQLGELDSTSVEAEALRAHRLHQQGEVSAAVEKCAGVIRRLRDTPDVRLYDSPDAESLRQTLEGFLLELSDDGVSVPSDIDLTEAAERRRAREEAAEAQQASQSPST